MGRNNQAYISVGRQPAGLPRRLGAVRSLAALHRAVGHLTMRSTLVWALTSSETVPSRASGSTFLWCPSDPPINGLRFFETQAGWDCTTIGICYTSYRGVCGTFMPGMAYNQTILTQMQGMFPDTGYGLVQPDRARPGAGPDRGRHRRDEQHVDVRREAQGKLSQVSCGPGGGCPFEGNGWWADADFGDSTMSTLLSPQPQGGRRYDSAGSNCDRAGRSRASRRRASIPAAATSPSPTARCTSSRIPSHPGTGSRCTDPVREQLHPGAAHGQPVPVYQALLDPQRRRGDQLRLVLMVPTCSISRWNRARRLRAVWPDEDDAPIVLLQGTRMRSRCLAGGPDADRDRGGLGRLVLGSLVRADRGGAGPGPPRARGRPVFPGASSG